MQVLIGQPLDYPSELITSLKNIMSLDVNIRRAYLAYIQYSDKLIPQKLLIGLEVVSYVNEHIALLKNKLDLENIDIRGVEFSDAINGPFKSYFCKIEPFYSSVL